jgi:hypothetical protein
MPQSVALTNFKASLALAGELMQLEAGYPDPSPPQDESKVRGLRGGAAVLMVAAFEGYLNSGIAEMLGLLLGPPPRQFSTLPQTVQIAAIYESLEFALYGPRHGRRGKKVDRLPEIIAAAIRITNGHIDPTALSQTKSNPGPDTVKRLLKNAGIAKPFAHIRPRFEGKWGAPEAASFLEDKLEEIVQRRNRVAHSANALAIGRSDLVAARRFLDLLAETIDEDFQLHVAAL